MVKFVTFLGTAGLYFLGLNVYFQVKKSVGEANLWKQVRMGAPRVTDSHSSVPSYGWLNPPKSAANLLLNVALFACVPRAAHEANHVGRVPAQTVCL